MNLSIQERFDSVNLRIQETVERCSRRRREVKLIGASKKISPEILKTAFETGLHCFGENRAQELKIKVPELPPSCEWHFIGGLQTNKVKDVVPLVSLIHSVDRFELAHEIDKRAAVLGKTQKILAEINIGEEKTKHGLQPEKAEEFILVANEFRNLEIAGLMCVAPFFEDLEKVRPFFKKLKDLRDRIQKRTGILLPELSMGMSHDFEIAIEEGSTMVRVGTALFGERTDTEEENPAD